MLSTLSPGGKLNWHKPGQKNYLGPDDISNPFIEKSDIANHIKKIEEREKYREDIQQVYKK